MVSPSWPSKQTLDKYDAVAEDGRGSLSALIQRRHTTKASLLLCAITEKAITSKKYRDYTFTILVEFHYPYYLSKNDHFDTVARSPIVMCTDEGSTEEFKKELERIFRESVLKTAKFHKFDIK